MPDNNQKDMSVVDFLPKVQQYMSKQFRIYDRIGSLQYRINQT